MDLMLDLPKCYVDGLQGDMAKHEVAPAEFRLSAVLEDLEGESLPCAIRPGLPKLAVAAAARSSSIGSMTDLFQEVAADAASQGVPQPPASAGFTHPAFSVLPKSLSLRAAGPQLDKGAARKQQSGRCALSGCVLMACTGRIEFEDEEMITPSDLAM